TTTSLAPDDLAPQEQSEVLEKAGSARRAASSTAALLRARHMTSARFSPGRVTLNAPASSPRSPASGRAWGGEEHKGPEVGPSEEALDRRPSTSSIPRSVRAQPSSWNAA